MNILLDILTSAIIAIAVFAGYYNGFVKTILKFFGNLVCIVVSFMYAPALGDFFRSRFIGDFFKTKVTEKLASILGTAISNIDIDKLMTDQPEEFLSLLKSFGISIDELSEKLNSFTAGAESDITSFVSENISSPCADTVSYVLAFVLILIVSLLLLKLLIWICDLIFKLPILRTADAILGTVTGAVIGIIGAFIFCILINALMPYISGIDNPFFSGVDGEKTLLFKFFSDHNPFESIISALGIS